MFNVVLLVVPLLASTADGAAVPEGAISAKVEKPPAHAAQEADALFPAAGRFAGTFSTGIPYLGIVELAYGVTDRFSVGALAGVTPSTYGVGLRIRGVVGDFGSTRLILGSPLLYYPATQGLGGEPWVLAVPTLRFEGMVSGSVRLHVSAGVAVAACTGMIGALFHGSIHHDHDDGEEGFVGGLWTLLGGGAAWQVTRSTVLFADALLVSRGLQVGHTDWIGGPPVIVTLGVQQAF